MPKEVITIAIALLMNVALFMIRHLILNIGKKKKEPPHVYVRRVRPVTSSGKERSKINSGIKGPSFMRRRLSRIVGALAVITLFGMIQGVAATQQIAEDKPASFSDRERMLLERIEKLERRLAELESRAPSPAPHQPAARAARPMRAINSRPSSRWQRAANIFRIEEVRSAV